MENKQNNKEIPVTRIGIDCGGVLFAHDTKYDKTNASHTEDTSSTSCWMSGALDALEELKKRNCELFIVSFAGKKRGDETRKTILSTVNHLIPENNIFIVNDRKLKGHICKEHNLQVLIDDRKDVLMEAQKTYPSLKCILFTSWKETLQKIKWMKQK
jgi:hypothetical protein